MSLNSDRYASAVSAIYQRHHCHVNMCHHRSLEKTNNVKPTGVPCVWQWHSSFVFYTPEQDDNTYGHAIAAVVVVVVVVAVDATIIVASQCRVIAENVLGLTSI
jgi:hypothetical protein